MNAKTFCVFVKIPGTDILRPFEIDADGFPIGRPQPAAQAIVNGARSLAQRKNWNFDYVLIPVR